ncbi:MAG: glycoside hydrolase family 99-like domain-containing protein, partial [Cellvibrionaceae bacterium]|nr:glycoside hydrolase family 99-like domain-containing protein [Cellvibrionaceae bacterium]
QLLLDEPLRHFHANKQHKLKYCITWANETWTRQWVGDPEILIKQTENPDRDIWRKHFDYLNTFFSDPRYLRKNKMPVLCLYRPEIFPFFDEYKAFFHERARAAGHDGIYWIGLESYPLANSAKVFKHFDAKMQFQPRAYFNAQARQASPLKAMLEPLLRALPESMQRPISGLKYKIDQHQSYDYEALWQHLIDQSPNLPSNTYQSLVVDWDNGARYGDKAKYLSGANPQTFFEGLSRLVELEKARGADLLFINAWNEWSEAAYLEPDTRHHYGYLEAIQAVKSQLT